MSHLTRLTVFICVFGLISALLTASSVIRDLTAAVSGFIILLCISWQIAVFIVKVAFASLFALISTRNKCVIVTGNESETEDAVIEKLCESGFKVFACLQDVSGDHAKKLGSMITSDKLVICQMSRKDKTSIDTCLRGIKENMKGGDRIWGLVTSSGFPFISKIDWGNFDSNLQQVIDGDLIGLLHLVRECLPLLRPHAGRIVNITSLHDQKDRMAFHCAAAISNSTSHSLMECVRREIAYFGVDVINVHVDYRLQTLGLRGEMSKKLEESWLATDESVRCQTQLHRLRKELDDCTTMKSTNEALQTITNTVEHALRAPFPEFTYQTSAARRRPLQLLASLFSG